MAMRVGVYIDGFNLYYGGRGICGKGTPGWRWLDIRKLATSICAASTIWDTPEVTRVVYCTAPVKGSESARRDQATYISALNLNNSVDHVEYGNFVERVNTGPLAVTGAKGKAKLVAPGQLHMAGTTPGIEVKSDRILVSYSRREEKGSDVNVASHLLVDTYESTIDAALVISNDSDLEFAVKKSRTKIPVGIINPTSNRLAGKLYSPSEYGAGQHFSMQLTRNHFINNQLPDPVESLRKPQGW